jgi:TonB family protein
MKLNPTVNTGLKYKAVLAGALTLFLAVPSLMAQDLKVSFDDSMKAASRRVQPVYNPLAKQMRVQGDVEVEATVLADGNVESVKVVSGNAMLTASVVRAVKDWKFTPFNVDGKPVTATATLRFSFKL